MTGVIILSDLDGTITAREGSKTVYSPFYQSLLEGYQEGKKQFYKDPNLKDDVQQLFVEKFGQFDSEFDYSKEDSDILMDAEAVDFFHEMLALENVTIYIITKNRADYVKELLKYHGFSPEEINKIQIEDSGHKQDDVYRNLKVRKEDTHILILDDSGLDVDEMTRGAKAVGYVEEEIRAINAQPGQFEWAAYKEDVKKIIRSNQPGPDKLENLSSSSCRETFFAASSSPITSPINTPQNVETKATYQ
ncbi:hypothetical protein ACQUW5_00270 [Legionella sp. CNM-1927-20]|uniref:hypothetical protein n=1 Tax=Legionella sp. CNM-1927-20 TaxID=3422221 RepID=UPI00403AE117